MTVPQHTESPQGHTQGCEHGCKQYCKYDCQSIGAPTPESPGCPCRPCVRKLLNRLEASEDDEGILKGFACRDDDAAGVAISAAALPTCPKTCLACANQYRPAEYQRWPRYRYSKILDDEEAQRTIHDLVCDAKDDIAHVSAEIEVHGNVISKRWQKRSIEKRAALLISADASLCRRKHRTCELYEQIEEQLHPNFVPEDHAEWLLQYLDVETLSQNSHNLLSLLHCRTRFSPVDWMAFDTEQFGMLFTQGVVPLVYNPHCVVMHGPNYGSITAWEKEAAHRWDIMGYPRALLTFQAQYRLARFLRKVVDLLTIDAQAGNDKWKALVAADFNRNLNSEIACPSNYQIFTRPPILDFQAMTSAVAAKRDAAMEDLLMLQRDPAHVRTLLLKVRSTARYQAASDATKQDIMVRFMLSFYQRFETWQATVEQVERVSAIASQFDIAAGSPSLLEYNIALTALEAMMAQTFFAQSGGLEHLCSCLPTFQGNFTQLRSGYWCQHSTHSEMLKEDPLYWAISRLSRLGSRVYNAPTRVFTVIDEELLSMSRKERARIDEVIVARIRDLAVIDEALSELRCHVPVPGQRLGIKQFIKLTQELPEARDFQVRIDSVMTLNEMEETHAYYQPLRDLLDLGHFAFLGLNVGNAKEYGASHIRLCSFWDRVLFVMRKSLELQGCPEEKRNQWVEATRIPQEFRDQVLGDALAAIENFGIEAMKQYEMSEKKAVSSPQPTKGRIALTDTEVQSVWGPELASEPTFFTPKQKQKRRPALAEDSTPIAPPTQALAVLDIKTPEPIRIAVNPDSLSLFQRMYSSQATTKATADVKWEVFLASMRDAGCVVRQSGGSAVTFIHESAKEGNMTVHRPHPDPTINPIMLRSFGKKIEAKFGWVVETFVERER